MRSVSRWLFAFVVCGCSFLRLAAQCPDRPISGTVVDDPLALSSQNGVLSAQMTLAHSVDGNSFTHYCYNYTAGDQVFEAPTLRVSPGDELDLKILNRIQNDFGQTKPKTNAKTNARGRNKTKMTMPIPESPDANCGDGGDMTIDATNVHYHGMNISPKCHQDDVINTLIQPGSAGFQYKIPIPATQPPGLYWYHPHVHGFTEFQVNGGAAGALIVEGMEKVHPEVAGLTERVFVIRQQFLVPWVPGPYELTINYQVAPVISGAKPVIQMKPGEKQFWRVANATIQDFMPLQVIVDNQPQPLQVVALDGYPLAQIRTQDTIVLPPAGRAEFIVQAPPVGSTAYVFLKDYSTGPTGNADLQQSLGAIQITNNANFSHMPKALGFSSPAKLKFADLAAQKPTAERKLFFSEEFAGTNGPIQFYITVEGQKQKVFEANEKPVITTKVGAVEDWTIENRALETHAFHMHQIHFQMLEIDGKPVANQDMRDTIEIPFWEGTGPFHSVKVRMDFRDPTIAGTFLFHCHILLHEDLGMMHKILVEP
ncbi:MAG: multicopper oxidase domain-containing protein [Acidobacteria bacterium]|nr:multicopper oxidase domain-containing protein [Acidobacteriota bacterium]